MPPAGRGVQVPPSRFEHDVTRLEFSLARRNGSLSRQDRAQIAVEQVVIGAVQAGAFFGSPFIAVAATTIVAGKAIIAFEPAHDLVVPLSVFCVAPAWLAAGWLGFKTGMRLMGILEDARVHLIVRRLERALARAMADASPHEAAGGVTTSTAVTVTAAAPAARGRFQRNRR